MSQFDETCDFVVIGCGGGSMCAGLVMREAGKSVVILEKTEFAGGTTAMSGGVMWIPNNRFMAADGVNDSLEKARLYLDTLVGEHADAPGATPQRRETYLREAPAMIEFLIVQGIKLRRSPTWPDYYDDQPGGSAAGRTVVADLFDINQLGSWKTKLRANAFTVPAPIYDATELPLIRVSWRARRIALRAGLRSVLARLTGKQWVTAGAALQGRMLQAALRSGTDIRLSSPVTELIVENGAVVGVVTTKDGAAWRINARLGVLMNAGGFGHNQAMRDKYIPFTRSEWCHAGPGDTGDMHIEAMRLGAAVAQMEERVGSQVTRPPGAKSTGVQMQLAKPHAFLVDQIGDRYLNEAGSYMAFCKSMLARHRDWPAIPSWMIMDSSFLRRYMLAHTMPGERKPRAWFETGYLRKGETIEELAQACGIDPARLRATTDRFNSHAREGRDPDFHRGERAYDRWLGDYTHGPSPTLGPVETGPFYAVEVFPGDVGTFGGVVTDVHARVLRVDGSVIPGLYATGTTTASVMGRAYPGAGSSVGPSFTWGYVAARHAVADG